MSTQENNWAVNFYYEQDLRSVYMNGLLNGGLHPGIFNGNFVVFIKNKKNSEGNLDRTGIYLLIKKGTVLNFSNVYQRYSENNIIKRDLNTLGSYFIKATALEDIVSPLLEWDTNEESEIQEVMELLGDGRKNTHLITASIAYNKDAATNKTEPIFNLVDIGSKGKNLYTKYGKDSNILFPDGFSDSDLKGFDRTGLLDIGWLCVGILNEKTEDSGRYISSYINYNKWVDFGGNLWIMNHTFTARGLPDYSYNINYSGKKEYPDILFSPDCSYIQIKNSDFYVGENFIKIPEENNLEILYGLKKIKVSKENNNKIFFKIGDKVQNQNEILNDFSIEIKPTGPPKIKIAREKDSVIICDFSYLEIYNGIKNEKNLQTPTDISIVDLSKNSEEYKLKSIRWNFFINGSHTMNFSPYYKNPNEIEEDQKISLYSISGVGPVLPLDKNTININRLENILKESRIIPLILTYMRNNSLISFNTEKIVPISISFREFKPKEESINSHQKPFDVISDCTDLFSRYDIVNPLNTLSFFDIQFENSNSIPVISLRSQPYISIPII